MTQYHKLPYKIAKKDKTQVSTREECLLESAGFDIVTTARGYIIVRGDKSALEKLKRGIRQGKFPDCIIERRMSE